MIQQDLRAREEAGNVLRKKKRNPFDIGFNWLFILGLTAFSFSLIAQHLDQFRDETWFYNMAKDGLTPDDVEKYYQKDGLTRNMKYKDYTKSEFKMAIWKWRIPRYLLLLAFPLFIATFRVLRRKRPGFGLNVLYYSFAGLAIVHAVYSIGGINAWW